MDTRCLDYMLRDAERQAFERDGYLIVENALTPAQVELALAATDRLADEARVKKNLGPRDRVAVHNFAGRDEAFLELVDLPQTFARVWGLLGWNIQLYHSHLNITPPEGPDKGHGLSWHQDSGRLNLELETNPQPRVSLKVGFFLTDCTQPGRGNFQVLPGSHLQNEMDFPDGNRKCELPGRVPVLVPAGTAVFFDRRIWHSSSANHWHNPRKVLFYGYSYRWLRPRDEVTLDERLSDRMDPVREQLFGASPTGNYGYTSPNAVDVPLRAWIESHAGAEAVAV